MWCTDCSVSNLTLKCKLIWIYINLDQRRQEIHRRQVTGSRTGRLFPPQFGRINREHCWTYQSLIYCSGPALSNLFCQNYFVFCFPQPVAFISARKHISVIWLFTSRKVGWDAVCHIWPENILKLMFYACRTQDSLFISVSYSCFQLNKLDSLPFSGKTSIPWLQIDQEQVFGAALAGLGNLAKWAAVSISALSRSRRVSPPTHTFIQMCDFTPAVSQSL